MKVLKVISVCAVLAMALASFAQQGGGRGTGGGRGGGFGGGQGRMGMQRGNRGGLSTLMRSDVQKDLNLNDEQKAKLKELQDKSQKEMAAMREEMRNNGGGDRNAMNEKMAASQEEQKKAIKGILTEEQNKRLGEIQIQLQGGRALLDPEVQKALGLTEEQKTQMQDVQKKQRDEQQAMMEKSRSGEMDPQAAMEAFRKMNEKLGDELKKVLTADQQTKFQTMQGKPFKADPPKTGGIG